METEVGEDASPLRRIRIGHGLPEKLEILIVQLMVREESVANLLTALVDEDLRDLVADG